MSIRLLIADPDARYTEHLSEVLSKQEKYGFEVSVCRDKNGLAELAAARHFDILLANPMQLSALDHSPPVRLVLLLTDDNSHYTIPAAFMDCPKLQKFQRISLLCSDILEQYAKVSVSGKQQSSQAGHITAVYSPVGGCGKTTVALAYAMKRVSEGAKTLYLCMESFSSTALFFPNDGKSISHIFARLDNSEGSVEELLRSACREDLKSGVFYLCPPQNYDDVNVLSDEEVQTLLRAAARGSLCRELVVDLSSACDTRCRRVLELADKVLLVTDGSPVAKIKMEQFTNQCSSFGNICDKTVQVINKGGDVRCRQENIPSHAFLPAIPSGDCALVCRTLAAHPSFEV